MKEIKNAYGPIDYILLPFLFEKEFIGILDFEEQLLLNQLKTILFKANFAELIQNIWDILTI